MVKFNVRIYFIKSTQIPLFQADKQYRKQNAGKKVAHTFRGISLFIGLLRVQRGLSVTARISSKVDRINWQNKTIGDY